MAAERERNAQLRAIADQAHGANLDSRKTSVVGIRELGEIADEEAHQLVP